MDETRRETLPGTKPMRVLLIDDGIDDGLLVKRALMKQGQTDVHQVRSGRAGLETLSTRDFDLCLVDHRLPDCDGLQLLRQLRPLGRAKHFAMVTSNRSEAVAQAAFDAGAVALLYKDLAYEQKIRGLIDRLRRGDAP